MIQSQKVSQELIENPYTITGGQNYSHDDLAEILCETLPSPYGTNIDYDRQISNTVNSSFRSIFFFVQSKYYVYVSHRIILCMLFI